ncbi:MAG: ATP-dependent zinc metalloprotease FtsH [Acidimicrobiales bacterium]
MTPPGGGPPTTPFAAPPRRWRVLFYVVLALLTIGMLVVWRGGVATAGSSGTVDYATFLGRVTHGKVSSVTLHVGSGEIEGEDSNGKAFTAQGPPGGLPDADLALLARHHVSRIYAAEPSNALSTILVSVLPVLLIVGAILWMSRRAGRQLGGLASFGRSKARLDHSKQPTTTFADVAGYEAVKAEISEVVDFLREPSRFQAMGARIPKGILLVGPPGTGKTLFARAVAGEAGVPFLSITASEFLEMFVGVGAARVRDLFETARKERPCIVFVDEIDAIGRKRGAGLGGGQDEREQTLNQLLAEMDGFTVTEGIVMLAATNRPDILDPALLRAGRFDRQVVIPLPTQQERVEILKVHAAGKQMAPEVDFELIARGTPGMSGADLANLVNEAALNAVRRGGYAIGPDDFDAARDRLLMGLRRSSLVVSDEEKRLLAHHEAGHAVLAELLDHADPVHKVTILPTGVALGATQQMPDRESLLLLRPELDDAIAVQLGGRAAEELVFGVASTGAHDDLIGATQLARRMVTEWGMSERLGHLAWGSSSAVFLGEDLIQTRDFSDETARVIDEETERILEDQAARARELLERHRGALEAVAAALLAHETLSGDEVDAVIRGVELPSVPSVASASVTALDGRRR